MSRLFVTISQNYITGLKGEKGRVGPVGPPGFAGSDGVHGFPGIKGQKGDPGDLGARVRLFGNYSKAHIEFLFSPQRLFGEDKISSS